MNSWTLEPMIGPVALLAVAVAMLLLLTIRPSFHSLTPRRRRTLTSLRFAATLLLLTAMLRPGCVRIHEEQQSATLLLMFDQSRSMQLPHDATGLSRWSKLTETLNENQSKLGKIAEKLDVKLYGFDGILHQLVLQDGRIELPKSPQGGETDMASTLEAALTQERDGRIAATVILGDGVQNADDPTVELQQAAKELDRLQLPLYTVPFGQQADAGQLADVAVENMPDQYSVFVKNELKVSATLNTRGYVNRQIPVQLIVEQSDGQQKVVSTRQIEISDNVQQQQVELSYIPQEPGQFKLLLRAEQQPQERVTRNNELPAFLTVYDGGLRVLYIEGDLRNEQLFLRRSIAASPDIELDFLWIDHRNRDRWPVDLSDNLRRLKYDVYIIGDLDARAIYDESKQTGNLDFLLQEVEDGKGLLMLGGYHSFGPGRYHSTPLVDALPIKMEKFEAQDFDVPLNHDLHIERPLQMTPSANHFITSLMGGDSNAQAWSALPPLDGANRFFGVKDRAMILAESRRGDPLLVAGSYGGRVLAFAGDSTWRWWMQGHQEAHKRFWRQVILWLARRDGMENQNVWIDLAQRRYDPGSTIEFSTGARNATGQDIVGLDIKAALILPDGKRLPLNSRSRDNYHLASIEKANVAEPGTYTIEVAALLDGNSLGIATADFIVFDRDKEKANPSADPSTLARMANQTSAWGGRMVPAEEFGDLLSEIAKRPLDLKIRIPQKWQLGDTWLDGLVFFALFLGVLSTEWFLRKKWGMV